MAIFASNSSSTNSSSPVTVPPPTLLRTLHIIGDQQSVQDVMDVLVSSSCDVFNSTILPFNASSIPSGNNSTSPSSPSTLQPEQVIQYYRSSSFALTMDGYNNTAALASNAPPAVSWSNNDNNDNATPSLGMTDTALPTDGTDMNFVSCVNQTIGQALPIMNGADRLVIGGGGLMMPSIGLLWLFVLTIRSFV